MRVTEFLRWWIGNSGLSQKEFAERCGTSCPMLNEIIRGKRNITPKGAIFLEKGSGIPAIVWLSYQDHDDLEKLKKTDKK